MLEKNIVGPRAPTDEELPQVINFLNTNLRNGKDWSIVQEYPTAFAPNNLNNIRVVFDESAILAHAVVRPLIIKTPVIIYKVAAIGSVVTHPKYRGQGLSREILLNCLNEAHQQQCDFAILWTDLFNFYQKIGFTLAGTEICLQFDNPINVEKDINDYVFLQSNRIAADAILRLYNQHVVTTIRSSDEIVKYLAIPNSAFFTLWNKNNKLAAYAAYGKGADFDGYIHEWGGTITALFQLINQILMVTKKSVNLICPNHSQNFLKQAVQCGARQHKGYLGMVKITNEKSFFDKIHRAARNSGVKHFVLQKNEDHYLIGIGTNLLKIVNESALLPILFDPQEHSHFANLTSSTKAEFARFLPLPLWLWGWDSI